MSWFRKPSLVALVAFCAFVTLVVAAPPTTIPAPYGNSYHFCPKDLHVDDSGRVAIPSRFKWSVETSYSGVDNAGNRLPDTRVMLRLYDPDRNFTAFTAQMDLATAARLHHELGEIIVKRLEDRDFEHRPQLYDPKLIPIGRLKGVDDTGTAIIEFEHPEPSH